MKSTSNNQTGPHPDETTLRAFSLGQLDEPLAATIEDHFASCEACCQAMLEISSADAFVELLQESHRCNTEVSVTLNGNHQAIGHIRDDEEIRTIMADHPRYELLELIGRGGMGYVYRARHRVMARTVALKVIHPKWIQTEEAARRFYREIQTVSQLTHVNLVTALDAEQSASICFLVMVYVEGENFEQLIRRRGALPVAEACRLIHEAAVGIRYAHEQGLVHRDIKPQNLMVTTLGGVLVLDFGLASVVASISGQVGISETREVGGSVCSDVGLTTTGDILGTPDFMSPEQTRDARLADTRSDIYSLGMTFYFLLSGRLPFGAGSAKQKLLQQQECEPQSLSSLRDDLPPALLNIVNRMIAKDPAQRFQTVRDFEVALKQCIRIPDARSSFAQSGRLLRAAVPLLVAAAMVGILLFFSQQFSSQTNRGKLSPIQTAHPTADTHAQPGNVITNQSSQLIFSKLWSIPVDEQTRPFTHALVTLNSDRNAMISRNFLRVQGEQEMKWTLDHPDRLQTTLWSIGAGITQPKTTALGTGTNFGFVPHSNIAFDVSWSDGIVFYDIATHSRLTHRIPHELREDTTLSPAIRSDGKLLAARTQLDHIQFWNPQTGVTLSDELKQSGEVLAMMFSADNRWFFSQTSKDLLVWRIDGESVTPVAAHRNDAMGHAYNSRTQQLVTIENTDHGMGILKSDLVIRSAETDWQELDRITLEGYSRQVKWINDTHLLAIAQTSDLAQKVSPLYVVSLDHEHSFVMALLSRWWIADSTVASDQAHFLTRTYNATTCWKLGQTEPVWTKSVAGPRQLQNLSTGEPGWLLLHEEGKSAIAYSVDDGRELWRRDQVLYAGSEGREIWICDRKGIELWSVAEAISE